jgi:hypothetical protein
VRFVDLDFVDAAELADERPAPPPPPHVLRSRPSLAVRLEADANRLSRSLPGLIDDARATIRNVDGLVADARASHLPERLADLADRTGAAVTDARALAPRASAALARVHDLADHADGAIGDLRHLLARLDGDGGLAASAQRATDAAGDLGRQTVDSTTDLQRALRDLDDTARAIRDFVDELERDPDMLVKGRAPARRP